MDLRRGDVYSEQQDFQMPGPWIPTTPGKPVLVKRQHTAAAGGQGNHVAGANWLETAVGLPPVASFGSWVVREAACQVGSSGSAGIAGRVLDLNSCEAAVAYQGGVSSGKISPQAPAMRGATQGWHQVRYSGLVAMAANADAPRTYSPPFVSGNIMSGNQRPSTPLLLNGRILLNTGLLNGAQSLSASCGIVTPPFAPVTPDKQKGTQDVQHLGSADSADGEERARERLEQASVPPTLDPKGKGTLVQFQFDQAVSEQTYFSSVGLPSQLQENETQEKAEPGVDTNKTPAQKPRRKKHRPKVVAEGKQKRTPQPATPRKATPKPAGPGESTPGKRKYVRRKGLNSSSETSPSVLGGEAIKPHVKKARSARRHLQFSDEHDKLASQGTTDTTQVQVESLPERNVGYSTGSSTSNGTMSTNVVKEGQGVDMNPSAGIALALNCSNNQILDGYLNSLQIPSLPLQPSRRKLIRENLKKLARIRDSLQVPNHESTTQSVVQTGCQSTLGSLPIPTSDPNMLLQDRNMRRNECNLENNILSDDARLNKVNAVPAHFACTCKYNEVNVIFDYSRDRNNHLPCFPETPKKRRTQKVQNAPAFNDVASFADAQRRLEFERLRAMEGKQAFGQKEVKTGKRTNVPTECCNLDSLVDNMKSDELPADPQNPHLNNKRQENGAIHGPQACVEALAADILAKVKRKRRTKKGQSYDLNFSLESHNTSNCYAAVPYVQGNEVNLLIDIIIHKMACLNIDKDLKENKFQSQSAIVPYGAHGMVIPFEGQFDPRKKSRPRAKVDLDQETNRVWKLLMGKEDGIEGTDMDKERWWEEERRVFRGRADSFIARMHLVQGDRRFSPWKGSVLDSVIGVFLTQNVSDHLSSSAFMALAARFPQSRAKYKETNCDMAITSMEQSTVCTVDLNITEKGSDQQACDHIQIVVHEARQTEENEIHPTGSSIVGDTFPYSDTSNTGDRSLTHADYRRLLDDIHSSQNSVVSSQNSSDDLVQIADQFGPLLESKSDAVDPFYSKIYNLESRTSFVELLEIAGTSGFQEFYACSNGRKSEAESCNTKLANNLKCGWPFGEERPSFSQVSPTEFQNLDIRGILSAENATAISNQGKSVLTSQSSSLRDTQPFMANLGDQCFYGSSTNTGYGKQPCDDYIFPKVTSETLTKNSLHGYSGLQEERTVGVQKKERDSGFFVKNIQAGSEALFETQKLTAHQVNAGSMYIRETSDVVECFGMEDKGKCVADKGFKENSKEVCSPSKDPMGEASSVPKTKRGKSEKNKTFDWESLRRQACQNGAKRERSIDTMDSLDWEAVRNADVSEISNTIRERGMNNMLAERIKSFLNRLVTDHGSIDLEWLRDVPPDKAKDYLLSVRGLGLKSVECVRLLTLHHLAFPVDTNVGRICVRLGWVPLQPLPESLQLHLLELYPMLETIQKYLWPRLCTLDQRILYELHYQMITFGKVFCTKSKPNCNACPMRGECKHFASAFASARLALPGPEEKGLVTTMEQNHKTAMNSWPLPQLEGNSFMQQAHVGSNCEPIVEEPATPEPECTEILDIPDIEDAFCEDPDEIPTIKLNAKEFAQNLQSFMEQNNMELQNVDWSKALVTLTPEAASIPMPKLKNVSRLRTEHQVYELPDSHPLLEGLDQREPQDPCPYLLAIWTPGETAQSTEPPQSCSNAEGAGNLCDKMTCFACNSLREAQAQTVRGTLLIPCRTAMRGSFPLNGTYFQVNEVFADHVSSLNPIDVPRSLLWNLPRRTVYFGTSIPTIFRGLAIEDIQNCFWRGFVCVRGFDRRTRGPRPLMARFHFPASKATKGKKSATKSDE